MAAMMVFTSLHYLIPWSWTSEVGCSATCSRCSLGSCQLGGQPCFFCLHLFAHFQITVTIKVYNTIYNRFLCNCINAERVITPQYEVSIFSYLDASHVISHMQ